MTRVTENIVIAVHIAVMLSILVVVMFMSESGISSDISENSQRNVVLFPEGNRKINSMCIS